MKMWKVYAQCCTRARRITEANDNDLRAAMEEILNIRMDDGSIEIPEDADDEEIDKIYADAYGKLQEKFDKNGIIEAGDYQIVVSEEIPDVPNVCGWEEI